MPADIFPVIKKIASSENESVSTGGLRPNIVSTLIFALPFLLGLLAGLAFGSPASVISGTLLGLLASRAPRVAKQWERAVVLRLGRYMGLRGPGLFWVVPLLDSVAVYVDQRIITTNFAAEQTLTADTVPVNVDAV
ncbi:MAG: slipin family protein, partial [Blastocatellia bacterium]|nr:slipin family protein [Blastocatellia bacterium]